jgi:predicted Zn-dependent protease
MSHTSAASPRWGTALAVVAALGLLVVAAVVFTRQPPPPPSDIPSTATSSKVADIIAAAEKLRLQGDTAQSETVLRTAAREYATDQSLQIALAELLIEKAGHAPTQADANLIRTDAYSSYERALAIGPRDPKLEFVAGTLAAKLGNLPRAVEHYSSAQAADATDARFPLYLAQVQISLKQDLEAKANLLLAAKLSPDNPVVWGTLADIAVRENKIPIALQHIRRARELEPRSVLWRVIEARALKRDNKPEEALQLLIGLDANERLEPGVAQVMAESYGMLSKFNEAADVYAAASAANPTDGVIALEAARWLKAAGRTKEAREHADRAAILGVEGAREIADAIK